MLLPQKYRDLCAGSRSRRSGFAVLFQIYHKTYALNGGVTSDVTIVPALKRTEGGGLIYSIIKTEESVFVNMPERNKTALSLFSGKLMERVMIQTEACYG